MFGLVMWFWVNLFITMVNQLEIKIIPKNKILKVLMYITFPLLIIVETLPKLARKFYRQYLRGSIDKLAIRFINLIDRLNGTYGNTTHEQAIYIASELRTNKPTRYRGGN